MGFLDGLLGQVSGALGNNSPTTSGRLGSVLSMVDTAQAGALANLVQAFAALHGIDVNKVSSELAQLLPVIVDKLTPNGVVPPTG